MPNSHVLQVAQALRNTLMSTHAQGVPLSSASKGRARENFVNDFLRHVFPNSFRFGTGDIADKTGAKTGQVDVVIEFPFFPSLPSIPESGVRLYFAEGVAAVIEVKSNIADQWKQVETTYKAVAALKRDFQNHMALSGFPVAQIPFFAVGYKGWSDRLTVAAHCVESGIDGVLVIESGIGVFKMADRKHPYRLADGEDAILALISSLHDRISQVKLTTSSPWEYGSNVGIVTEELVFEKPSEKFELLDGQGPA